MDPRGYWSVSWRRVQRDHAEAGHLIREAGMGPGNRFRRDPDRQHLGQYPAASGRQTAPEREGGSGSRDH